MSANSDAELRPQKRVKLTPTQLGEPSAEITSIVSSDKATLLSDMTTARPADDASKEHQVGITVFIDNSQGGFNAIFKKRYTDFLVNEILPGGSVLHLRNLRVKSFGPVNEQEVATEPGPSHAEAHAVAGAGESVPTTREANDHKTGVPGDVLRNGEHESRVAADQSTSGNPNPVSNVESEQISEVDRAKLVGYFGEDTVTQMFSLHQSILSHPQWKSRDHPIIRTPFTSDRSVRSQIHQDIRRIFFGKIESSTDKDGVLVLTAAGPSHPNSNRNRDRAGGNSRPQERGVRQGKLGWLDRGGEFLHFTLYKENKDTLEVISYLTKQLKTNTKTFQFAGTKDRRAVTVQRVSAYRVEAGRLAGLNRTLRYAAVGDFEYQKHGLELGDLSGNEFLLTLRDCSLLETATLEQTPAERIAQIQEYLSQSFRQLRDKGFLNYYGLQRFGTYSTRTDVIGVKILRDDFEAACDAILEFSPAALRAGDSTEPREGPLVGQEDISRAEAIHLFRTTGKINESLDKLPRKFNAESALIRHLGKKPQDFLGALLAIQRNLRLMYVHAYQSLVWNLAAGERWRLYGGQVVEGDLVLVKEHRNKEAGAGGAESETTDQQAVDADGEVIIEPSGEDRAYNPDDMFERARALTAAEAEGSQYSIFDVVLPLPGFDVLYPRNATGTWYETFMASEEGGGLDPHNMRRKQKDFSLSGGYRKVLARIGEDFEVSVHEYRDDEGEKQFVQTDMERIQAERQRHHQGARETVAENADEKLSGAPGADRPADGDENAAKVPPTPSAAKIAAVLKFQLGSSQYATMALREMSKGGVQAHKAEFMGGR